MAETLEMAWEQKKTNTEGNRTNTQGPEYHPLVPSQYKRGGLTVKGLRGCGLMVGGKGSILGFLPGLLLGKIPC